MDQKGHSDMSGSNELSRRRGDAIDGEARVQAMRANQRLDDHEDRCRERYDAIVKTLATLGKEVSDGFNRNSSRAWWGAGLAMTAMGAIILAFIAHFLEVAK